MKKTIKKMIFMITGIVLITGSASGANAGPNEIQALAGLRCDEAQEMTAFECADTRSKAKNAKCITDEGRNFAKGNAWATFCAGSSLILVCPCSCFDASTQIMTGTIDKPSWMDAAEITKDDRLVTLSDNAQMSQFNKASSYTTRDLKWTTYGPEDNQMYVFELSNGSSLSVTQNHALLLDNGVAKAAKDITLFDTLVSYLGEEVAILNISRRPAEDGNVYNFLVDGNTTESHFIIGEGVIVGDTVWQDYYGKLLNQIVIRK